MSNTNTNTENHKCNQIEDIITLKNNVQSHTERIGAIETKQTKQDDYMGEMREFRSVQMETNKYLSEIITQNAKFIDKLDSKYEQEIICTKEDIEELKNKLHSQDITLIKENVKQDEKFNKEKTTLILKVLGWTIGITSVLVGVIWKFLVP